MQRAAVAQPDKTINLFAACARPVMGELRIHQDDLHPKHRPQIKGATGIKPTDQVCAHANEYRAGRSRLSSFCLGLVSAGNVARFGVGSGGEGGCLAGQVTQFFCCAQ